MARAPMAAAERALVGEATAEEAEMAPAKATVVSLAEAMEVVRAEAKVWSREEMAALEVAVRTGVV